MVKSGRKISEIFREKVGSLVFADPNRYSEGGEGRFGV
jgi:hypothetical protein